MLWKKKKKLWNFKIKSLSFAILINHILIQTHILIPTLDLYKVQKETALKCWTDIKIFILKLVPH